MSTQQAAQPGRLAVVDEGPRHTIDSVLGLAPASRLPRWTRLITSAHLDWISQRWDSDSQVFTWKAHDCIAGNSGRALALSDLPSGLIREVVSAVALDDAEGRTTRIASVTRIVSIARQGQVASIDDIPEEILSTQPRQRWRAWTRRFEIADADPAAEWLRPEVRLAVVHPQFIDGRSGSTLPLGRISQPWLRQLMTAYAKNMIASLGPGTMVQNTQGIIRLSAFLETRRDHGQNARALRQSAMDEFARALLADESIASDQHQRILWQVSSVLTQARALGLTDNCNLPSSFSVRQHHYPKVTEKVRTDRGFPDATFRLLLGSDDLFGGRVLDLAAAIPGAGSFGGEVFVQAIKLAANFGRRPNELYELTADRLSGDHRTGAAQLLYDNFKSGRDAVWLPIDARCSADATAWVDRLEGQFPGTPRARLALLPAPLRNPRGDRHVSHLLIAGWFRCLVQLLHHAIVLGHLHRVTGESLDGLLGLTVADYHDGKVEISSNIHLLPARESQMMATHVHQVRQMHAELKHAPKSTDLPMFPCPIARINRSRFEAVTPARLEALGADWLAIAGTYPSPGIPGANMGRESVAPTDLQMRLFRHTYLQHLVDAGVDIFIVQELADHANVQTTIDSYVRVKDDRLREAVEVLNDYKVRRFAPQHQRDVVALTSRPARDMQTNDCDSPQVLALGFEGCEYDRKCYECDHYWADPSRIPDIKAEIHTKIRSINVLESRPETDIATHKLAVLRHDLNGWRKCLRDLEALLANLPAAERERVEMAATTVREFRQLARAGGVNLGQFNNLRPQ